LLWARGVVYLGVEADRRAAGHGTPWRARAAWDLQGRGVPAGRRAKMGVCGGTREPEGKMAVLGGALAVPCTCNPLQQG